MSRKIERYLAICLSVWKAKCIQGDEIWFFVIISSNNIIINPRWGGVYLCYRLGELNLSKQQYTWIFYLVKRDEFSHWLIDVLLGRMHPKVLVNTFGQWSELVSYWMRFTHAPWALTRLSLMSLSLRAIAASWLRSEPISTRTPRVVWLVCAL